MKIRCELCKSTARIYCDSDQAKLCWDCDSKVHSANFLVARHSRNLLCHVCQSPTPWNASGEKLGATVSVCERCVETSSSSDEKEESDDEIDEEEYDGDDDEVDLKDDEDEDGENQVVPWSSTPPPAASSSSYSEEESSSMSFGNDGDRGGGGISLKRTRADLCSEDDLDCASSQQRRILAMIPAAKSTDECADLFVHSLPPYQPSKVQKSTRKRFQAKVKRTVSPVVPLPEYDKGI